VTDPASLVGRLRATAERTVASALGGRPVDALIDFPNYPNPGDTAIWLGQLACLRSLGIGGPRFTCDFRTYDRNALAHSLDGGVILLTGGGSFGDLWPIGQECREDILRSFPDHPVIQLPQSIHFENRDAMDRARRVLEGHRDFTLLVRDDRSLEVTRRELGVNGVLCPDLALCLGTLDRPAAAEHDIVWLSRTDRESASPPPADSDIAVTDWVDEPGTVLRRVNYALMGAAVRRPSSRLWRSLLVRTYGPLAKRRLRRGLRVLARGRVVITDRLHGHILSLMMGVPHVVLDNTYGKISSFHRTWTAGADGVRIAGSAAEAVALARQLAGNAPTPAASGGS
jgi:pyruvyl transferase EpsO